MLITKTESEYFLTAKHDFGYLFVKVFQCLKDAEYEFDNIGDKAKQILKYNFSDGKTELWIIRKYGHSVWNEQINKIMKNNETTIISKILKGIDDMYFNIPLMDRISKVSQAVFGPFYDDIIVKELIM